MVIALTFPALETPDAKSSFFFFFWFPLHSFSSRFPSSPSPPPFFKNIDKDMRVDLARHQHQQHSNTNPNHYVNAPFSVPQSVASNYHLVSDPNGNPIGTESDIHGSDSASSSAASSFVHLPLATVDNISARSMLVRGGYDNVSLF